MNHPSTDNINNSDVTCVGEVELCLIDAQGNLIERRVEPNAVLRAGRAALASMLAGVRSSAPDTQIQRIIFGNGGSVNGKPRAIDTERNGLHGTTIASKAVTATIDPILTNRVTFETVLTYNDANGGTINEMGLQMANGSLYALKTFSDVSKHEGLQITLKWRITLL